MVGEAGRVVVRGELGVGVAGAAERIVCGVVGSDSVAPLPPSDFCRHMTASAVDNSSPCLECLSYTHIHIYISQNRQVRMTVVSRYE